MAMYAFTVGLGRLYIGEIFSRLAGTGTREGRCLHAFSRGYLAILQSSEETAGSSEKCLRG
jgi:hypothetical protein